MEDERSSIKDAFAIPLAFSLKTAIVGNNALLQQLLAMTLVISTAIHREIFQWKQNRIHLAHERTFQPLDMNLCKSLG